MGRPARLGKLAVPPFLGRELLLGSFLLGLSRCRRMELLFLPSSQLLWVFVLLCC